MAAKPAPETPSPSTIQPISTVWITSVFLKVMPTAKLRCLNNSTTQTVAMICAVPPINP